MNSDSLRCPPTKIAFKPEWAVIASAEFSDEAEPGDCRTLGSRVFPKHVALASRIIFKSSVSRESNELIARVILLGAINN